MTFCAAPGRDALNLGGAAASTAPRRPEPMAEGVAMALRCVSTPGGNKVGVPGVRDKIVSRYERPLDQILNSAREVLSRTGTVTNDDVVTKTLTARIDKRTVYVTVKEVEPLVTEVTVQVRTSRGTGDLTVASEIDKQIALGLVLPQN